MRALFRGAMLHHMNDSIEAKIELQLDGESFTGRVTTGSDSAEFCGWLGLMSVVESLLMDTARAGAPGRPEAQPSQ